MAAIDPSIDIILAYCRFPDQAARIAISQDGFASFRDIKSLTHSDIGDLAKGFSTRSVANGRITFGLKRTQLLKAVVDWVQDFSRISREPSLEGIDDEVAFQAAIDMAYERGKIRSIKLSDKDALVTSASPGKLKKDWLPWEETFMNFLSCIPGRNGVALSYVCRLNDEPDYSDEDDGDFEKLAIACAPLDGIAFLEDTKRVHQFIIGFTQNEDANTWIKDIMTKNNGRLDMQYLRAHYWGTGSKSVRIKQAQAVEKNLIYKNERVLSFELFCTRMKEMFTTYADNGEPYEDTKKIRLLLEKIQHPSLEILKNTLQVSYDRHELDYTFIVNSFAVAVAGLPEFTTRNASSVDTRTKEQAPSNGILSKDGSIFTGFYKNFHNMPYTIQKQVYDERDRLGIKMPSRNKRGGGGGGGRGGKGRNVSSAKKLQITITKNQKDLRKIERGIAAVNIEVENLDKKRRANDDDDDDVPDAAGNAFGGRNSKKNKN